MEKSESIVNISKDLVRAQSEMGNAVKGSENPFFKKQYADLNSIREACMPVLNKHNISVLQPTCVKDGKNYVETILIHSSGEFISSFTEIIAAKPNDAQSHGSGLSYARRYALQSIICIGAEDDDGNKAQPKPEQKPEPKKELLFLNKGTEAYQAAIDNLKSKTVTIEQIEKKYKLSPETKQDLINQSK